MTSSDWSALGAMAAAVVGAGALVLYALSLRILARQTQISEQLILIESKRDILAYAISGWISIESNSDQVYRSAVIGRINNPTFQPIYEISGQILNLETKYNNGTYKEVIKFEFPMVRPNDDVSVYVPNAYYDEIRAWMRQTYGENSNESLNEHVARPLAIRFQFRDSNETSWERDIKGRLHEIQ